MVESLSIAYKRQEAWLGEVRDEIIMPLPPKLFTLPPLEGRTGASGDYLNSTLPPKIPSHTSVLLLPPRNPTISCVKEGAGCGMQGGGFPLKNTRPPL